MTREPHKFRQPQLRAQIHHRPPDVSLADDGQLNIPPVGVNHDVTHGQKELIDSVVRSDRAEEAQEVSLSAA
jgi:hypothetical protein